MAGCIEQLAALRDPGEQIAPDAEQHMFGDLHRRQNPEWREPEPDHETQRQPQQRLQREFADRREFHWGLLQERCKRERSDGCFVGHPGRGCAAPATAWVQ